MIPGLENAEFVRYGVMHRNFTWIHQIFLNRLIVLRNNQNLFFAGQMTGVEGYVESAASGLVAELTRLVSSKGESEAIFQRRRLSEA